MSQVSSLIKKIEVYNKLTSNDRSSFLKSLAQVSPNIGESVNQSLEAAKQYIGAAIVSGLSKTQEDSPEYQQISQVQDSLADNLKDLEPQIKTLLQISHSTSNKDMKDKLNKAMRFVDNGKNQIAPFRSEEEINNEKSPVIDLDEEFPNYNKTPISKQDWESVSPGAKANPTTNSTLSNVKSQINFMSALTSSLQSKQPQEKHQALSQINSMVSSLLTTFKNQNSWGNIKDYILGRKIVVDALKSTYSQLKYEDLQSIPALDFGKAIPENVY